MILTLAVLLLAGAAFIATSLAVFTDTETITGNEFAFGTVDLTLSDNTALVTINPLVPGDTVTAPLTVSNTGNLALRYAMVSTTTENTLAGALVLTVKTGVTTCDDANWTTERCDPVLRRARHDDGHERPRRPGAGRPTPATACSQRRPARSCAST